MSTGNPVVNAVLSGDDDEVDLEIADKWARQLIESFNKRDISPVNRVGACILATVIILLEEGLDDHDVYSTVVSLTGEMLREPPDGDDDDDDE